MDRLTDLQTFVAVVETGSFSAAAERLKVAKSAVSRRVGALESRLGVQLFARTTRRLNLTDSGNSFYEHCVRILADLEEAESAVMQAHGELRGRLRVALPVSFGLRHMRAPILEFADLHPMVEFDLDFNDRRVDLLEEGMDVAVRIGRLSDSSLIARALFQATTVLCASPQYLQQHGVPETAADLTSHLGLVYSNVREPDRWVYTDPQGKKGSVKIPVGMHGNSGDFLCDAAAAGIGITLQPTFIAYEAIQRGELIALLTDHQWPRTPAYAVYPPTRHLSYRVRAFIDFLVDQFAGIPNWDRAIA